MAEKRPLTPEKQLLNLIEDPKTEYKSGLQAQKIRHHKLSLFSFNAWRGRISFFKKKLKAPDFKQLDVKTINKLLATCVFISIIYFVSNLSSYLMKRPNLKFEIESSLESSNIPLITSATSAVKKAVSYYLEKAEQRDIFKMAPKKLEADVDEKKAISSRIIGATKDLELVGISWSAEPDAIIEDTKALKTFFVKRGQMIGKVKVEAIFKDKVILSYEGEEMELR